MCPFGGEERKDETRFFDESCPLVHETKGTLPVQPSTRNPITTDQFSRWRPSLHSPSSSLRQFSDSDCPPRSPNVFLVDLTTPPFSSLPTIPFFHSIRTRINLALKTSNVRFRFVSLILRFTISVISVRQKFDPRDSFRYFQSRY